jgi:hypothetical protein
MLCEFMAGMSNDGGERMEGNTGGEPMSGDMPNEAFPGCPEPFCENIKAHDKYLEK